MKPIFLTALSLALLLSCADDEKLFLAAVSGVKASSFVVESVLAYDRYHPLQALDGDPLTAWNEGAERSGSGEWIEIAFDEPVSADEIRLMPGYYDPTWYEQNNRIKSAEISLDGGRPIRAEFTDGMDEKTIALEKETSFSGVRLTIKGVYKGTKYDDTCLAEIGLYLHQRKIELDTAAPTAKLAEEDRRAQITSMDSPMGKMVDWCSMMGYGDMEFFFPDHVYVKCDRQAWSDSRLVGAWGIDDGKIKIHLMHECLIEGVGNKVMSLDGYGPSYYYKDYRYTINPIDKTSDYDWEGTVAIVQKQQCFACSIEKIEKRFEKVGITERTADIEERMHQLKTAYKETLKARQNLTK